MNFSLNADPEPDLLLAILRQISLIENKQESRRPKLGKCNAKSSCVSALSLCIMPVLSID
jgi:hypothetical protein